MRQQYIVGRFFLPRKKSHGNEARPTHTRPHTHMSAHCGDSIGLKFHTTYMYKAHM